jgi:hypothetical protein
MDESSAFMVINAYLSLHKRILEFSSKLSQSQLTWQAKPGSLPIAFYLWHLGRWADHLQASLPGMTAELSKRFPPGQQVWDEYKKSQFWISFSDVLGYAETGMSMEETAASQLQYPPKKVLLDYVQQAFSAVERLVLEIDEIQFYMEEQPQPITEGIWAPGGTVGGAILVHLIHNSRHLGMMECLLGLQSDSGSATV